jgi:hypothetical protein
MIENSLYKTVTQYLMVGIEKRALITKSQASYPIGISVESFHIDHEEASTLLPKPFTT